MFLNISNLKRKHYIKSYAFNAFLITGCVYGSCQLFSDRGLFTLYKLNQTIKQKQLENGLLEERQKYLEARVKKLEPGEGFDYDYLDEIVRDKLGVVKPTEKVIYVESNS
ncbi:MAG: septum formation initiator family protein [Proteobacteria bacterium]|nr:septum formation initiator family protein [Pseudomonadota bacterium]